MNRSSAFARVIGLTRSLSPFEREPADQNEMADEIVAGALADEAAQPLEAGAIASPALAQVTLVTAETELPATLDDVRQTVTTDAITAIEADIASLIASIEAAGEDNLAASEDGGADEPTLVLLSELDRLWRADAQVQAA